MKRRQTVRSLFVEMRVGEFEQKAVENGKPIKRLQVTEFKFGLQ